MLLATWVPMFAAFTALLIFAEDGGVRVFTVIATVVFADIGGYVAGVLFGKHLMAPAISPKKSWEGLGGSLVFGTAAAVLVGDLPAGQAGLGRRAARRAAGASPACSATWSNLRSSAISAIKDMGTLLPGHGGIMDRIDAMLPSAVVGWIVLTLLV